MKISFKADLKIRIKILFKDMVTEDIVVVYFTKKI